LPKVAAVTVETLAAKGGSGAADAPEGVALSNEGHNVRTTHTTSNDQWRHEDVDEGRVIAQQYFWATALSIRAQR
jgi:hypothetical protein